MMKQSRSHVMHLRYKTVLNLPVKLQILQNQIVFNGENRCFNAKFRRYYMS